MAAEQIGVPAAVGAEAMALRSLVCGVLAKKPEFTRSEEGGEVCRLTLIGKAAGPASKPPRVSLYITNGDGALDGLRPDEARRCGSRLRVGDVIEAAGELGPERRSAGRQEIIVDRRVRLRARAGEVAGAA